VSAEQQVSRLQGLLERIQRNAAAPRARPVAASPVSPAADPVVVSAAVPEQISVAVPPPEPEQISVAVPPPEPEQISVAVPTPEAAHEQITGVRAIEERGAAPEIETGEVMVEVLDLDEEEFEDITDIPAEELDVVEIDAGEAEDEEPPASSRRAIAGSVGEALAGAAETVELDEGREIPLKTPPPESGPQVAPPPMGAPGVPEIDTGAGADVEMVSGTHPTTAQLGATVDLEEGEEAEFEMGEPIAEAPPVHLVRDEAEAELGRVPTPPPPAPLSPQVVARPAAAGAKPAHAIVHAMDHFQPQSFLELLDASLALGKD
jgi:hypothetical protein